MTDRLRLTGTETVGAPVVFSFEGRAIRAVNGDSIAAALAANSETALRQTRSGQSRGAFCGMGLCHDCLVTVDGRAAQRACMVTAREGMVVNRHSDGERMPGVPLAEPPKAPLPTTTCDLAIIGAGPAGMAAAAIAAEGGAQVTLIDERDAPGGQYFKPLSPGHAHIRPDAQHRAGDDWRLRLAGLPLDHRAGTTIWYARAEGSSFCLGLHGPDGAAWLDARAVILAAGAYERPAMVPGWTLPGVMTIGGAQTLARRYRVAPGTRMLIAGNGPLGLQLAAELTEGGCPPVAVLERARPSRRPAALAAATLACPDLARDAARFRLALARAGVPVLEGWEVTAVTGDTHVTGATANRLGDGDTRRFTIDAVAMGDGFLPQAELARLLGCATDTDPLTGFAIPHREDTGATSIPGLWLAGDAGLFRGARTALAQGEIAAAAALAHLGLTPPPIARAKRALARAETFQRALRSLYAASPRPLPQGETVLCRCESVTAAQAASAIAQGAADLGALKRMTRLGMGRCQGRYCAGPAIRLLAEAGHTTPSGQLFAPQLPARPVPAAALALEQPEWGGHRRAEPVWHPPDRPASPLPARADMAIIGGGIIGVAAAFRAAELGFAPVVIERGTINSEASGGNAGSLHLQLLSFDYGEKALDRGGALLQTLPLQAESIALWQELEQRLQADFEISVGGGLMLAEDPDSPFLKAKIAAERSVGIDVEFIGRNEIATIAPEVSSRMTAAAWCPGEGKINPLRATPALAAAARSMGARFAEHTGVSGLSHDGTDFIVETTGGTLRAPRLVMAAGGWTARLGAMLGHDLPVRGAPLQMIVTETAPPIAPCMLAHADRHLTMKQAASGNLILGGAWTAANDPTTGRSQTLADSIAGNLWVAQRVAPAVASLHMLRTWAAMNVDIDGAPLLSTLPGLPNAVVAATANGYTLGPLMGFHAAEMAAGMAVPQALAQFSLARF